MRENSQLRSELEVMEGEHSRLRTDFEILESESNRMRGEVEMLTQANQIVEAEKESFETEVQRLTAKNISLASESDHLRDETQRLSEMETSAESEINRLRAEIENLKQVYIEYEDLQKQNKELILRVESMEGSTAESEQHSLVVEELDWGTEGKIEAEHLQQSFPDQQLHDEISSLKEKVIELEKERNQLSEELQAARLKHGKGLQKLKILQGKNEKLQKELKAKMGGFSDLDQALEEEWKARISTIESERDEFKLKLDEQEKEKTATLNQLDVLQDAQEKYLELKESQDNTIQFLTVTNKSLTSQVEALEWKLSELEEQIKEQELSSLQGSDPFSSKESSTVLTEISSSEGNEMHSTLKKQVEALHEDVQNLSTENQLLKESVKSFEDQIISLTEENQTLGAKLTYLTDKEKSNISDVTLELSEDLKIRNEELAAEIKALKELVQKAETDTQTYKSSYVELHDEHETLKDAKKSLEDHIKKIEYQHLTMKAAYDTLYDEYQQLQDSRDNLKNSLGILSGERDRFSDEVESLKNQLEAMQGLEEDEIIHNLQQECFNLRNENNALKEEVTLTNEKVRMAEEMAEKDRNTIDKSVDVQDYLQQQLIAKKEEFDFINITNEHLQQQIKYLEAETAALRTQATQHNQAQEQMMINAEKLESQIEELRNHNQQLLLQV